MNYGNVAYSKAKRAFIVDTQPHVILKLKRTFARIGNKQFKKISIGANPDTARDLEWFLQRYPMTFVKDAEARLRELADQHRERESLVDRILRNALPARDFQVAEPAREYQSQAAELTIANGSLLLVDEMGLGKTFTAILVLTQALARPALVVVPKSVQRQWRRQINRFAPQLTVHILKKTAPYDLVPKPRGKKHADQMALPIGMGVPDILISTYSKLPGWAETLAPVINGVVFDEVQELRNGEKTDKGKAAKHIAESATVRIGLSGTPIYNYGNELFNVLDVLKPGALGTMREFSTEWLDGGAKEVTDPKALGSFLRAEGLMLRRTRTDVGRELPAFERIFHTIDYDRKVLESIDESARVLARTLLSEDKEETRGERMRAAEELSVMVRHQTGLAKAPYVADFVRMIVEGGEPVVLFGWHHDVYDIWLERLKDFKPLMATGRQSDKQKDDAVQAFAKGDSKVLIMSLRTSAGLDGLQYVCSTAVYGEFDYSPGVHEQCDTRIFRDGQDKPVFAYYLEADEGSDPIITTILKKKAEQLTGIRDPDADFFGKLTITGDHVRQLAERYLNKTAQKDDE